jgi:DNA polymerase sigma
MQNGLPEFKYLFMALKCMLKVRGYSETYHGYVGSYLLFCMLFEYLFQKYDSFASFDNQRLLSQDLLGFLDFYGTTDWSTLEVLVGRGVTRTRTVEGSRPVYFRFLSPENDDDIGARAFKVKEVFYFFRNRLQLIRHRNFRRGESVLKELLNPSLEEFAYPNRA